MVVKWWWLLQVMTIMFEVQDLAVASPATVSRCGMVYLEPSILGLFPFIRCWLKQLPEAILPHRDRLEDLFITYLQVGCHTNSTPSNECITIRYKGPEVTIIRVHCAYTLIEKWAPKINSHGQKSKNSPYIMTQFLYIGTGCCGEGCG